jgi:uncharacterized protein involved in response to NO
LARRSSLRTETALMTSSSARRAYRGPALFSYGFRPFFLLGAAWSAFAPLIWLYSYFGHAAFFTVDRDWHVHEMIFGYVGAVIVGFLMTAIPNWTGRAPILGAPLAGLVFIWLAGRAAMLFQTQLGAAAAIIDSAFLVLFAAAVWREILAGRNWRNAPVALLVTLLAGANIAFHVAHAFPELAAYAERAALGAIALLLSLIGGRVVPSFTRNWLAQRGVRALPAPQGFVDRIALTAAAVAIGAWIALGDTVWAGAAMVVAGLACLIRLSRWRGYRTAAEPLVWILHAGHAWLGAAFVLIGAAILAPEIAPRSAGIHALTAGAMGVMTLAMMTRATLGHTGRPLHAGGMTAAIYVCVNLAALTRVAAPFLGPSQALLLTLSGALWFAAFFGFVLHFGPMLVAPRRVAVHQAA